MKSLLLAIVLTLTLVAAAGAASGDYKALSMTELAGSRLAVTGNLSDLLAGSRARVIIPSSWERKTASAGHLRFTVRQNASCRYRLTYAVRSVLRPAQDTDEYVEAALPAASPRHLLDSGERGSRAFRVIRRPSSGGRVRLSALWVGVLTRRADIVAAGQIAFTEVRVTATSVQGDECHAGTWRESLGPTIGDSLAVARTRLHFMPKNR